MDAEEGSFNASGRMVRRAAEAAADAVKEEIRAEMLQYLAEARAASCREVESVVRHELSDIRSALAVLVPGVAASLGSLPHASMAPQMDPMLAATMSPMHSAGAAAQVAPSHERAARVRAQTGLQRQGTRKRTNRDAVNGSAPPQAPPPQAPPVLAPAALVAGYAPGQGMRIRI